jgi:16S rRNA (guanine1207-N2)-methyltransferase
MNRDVYFKKIINFNFRKQSLVFKTSQELFSSHDIDLGTRYLLRTVMESGYGQPERILDVGCGYGPLGLTFKKIFPGSLVHLVDRDALAVDYTRQNAELNGVTDATVYGSLGYDDVKRTDFDLILSNIPGKAGERVIRYMLEEAVYYLSPDGITAVVIVDPLEELVAQALEGSPDIEILFRKKRPGHTVFHYRFNSRPAEGILRQSAVERDIYLRNRMQVKAGDLEFSMQTASGLSEFDSLDYRSELLVKALQDIRKAGVRQAAVFNPGQGHTAVAIWRMFQPKRIVLVDRDLLSLRYTRINLISNGCPDDLIDISHQTGIEIQLQATWT